MTEPTRYAAAAMSMHRTDRWTRCAGLPVRHSILNYQSPYVSCRLGFEVRGPGRCSLPSGRRISRVTTVKFPGTPAQVRSYSRSHSRSLQLHSSFRCLSICTRAASPRAPRASHSQIHVHVHVQMFPCEKRDVAPNIHVRGRPGSPRAGPVPITLTIPHPHP